MLLYLYSLFNISAILVMQGIEIGIMHCYLQLLFLYKPDDVDVVDGPEILQLEREFTGDYEQRT